MSLYVTGARSQRHLVQQFLQSLKTYPLRIKITHDWTTLDQNPAHAVLDAQYAEVGVANADVILGLLYDPWDCYFDVGTEIGLALGKGKKVLLFCPWLPSYPEAHPDRSKTPAGALFFHHPNIRVVTTQDDLRAWLLNASVFPRKTTIDAAAAGDLPTLQWLRSQGCAWDESTTFSPCTMAAEQGQRETLLWLRAQGCNWDEGTCLAIVYQEWWDLLVWAQATGCPWDSSACYGAALRGRQDILEWLHNAGCPWDEWACAGAAEHGHFALLRWLISQGCPWDTYTYAGAAWQGRLDVLQWLMALPQACALTAPYIGQMAAQGGHLEVLKWLHSHGCPWDEATCSAAARGGQLDVLKWLRQHDCPWNEDTCAMAAHEGHLEVLKWLREQTPPCPWNQSTCQEAARNDQLATLQWAVTATPPCPCDWENIHDISSQRDHWPTVHWIRTTYKKRQWRIYYNTDDRPIWYLARLALDSSGLHWTPAVTRWLFTVTETTEHLLNFCLCPDLVSLLHTYV